MSHSVSKGFVCSKIQVYENTYKKVYLNFVIKLIILGGKNPKIFEFSRLNWSELRN